ncbi:MAG: carbonic anhydrase [Flavipsychrobacter sp.]|nr:carbonic anhydrase [Flavipsychrobacter sp.]
MMNNRILESEPVTTPSEALQKLKEGNFRFINNMPINKDLLNRIAETKDGQTPFAAILSCMDSRVSSELVFDQGLGDIFSLRIAGNVVTDGILGSLEYSTAVAGAKLILVMGHTNCGAVKGACDHVEMGYLSGLLEHIKPAVENEKHILNDRTSNNPEFVTAVAKLNVESSVSEIVNRSSIIRKLVEDYKLAIVPSMYNVATGKVSFSGFADMQV